MLRDHPSLIEAVARYPIATTHVAAAVFAEPACVANSALAQLELATELQRMLTWGQ